MRISSAFANPKLHLEIRNPNIEIRNTFKTKNSNDQNAVRQLPGLEIRNPNIEIRNKFKIKNSNDQNAEQQLPGLEIRNPNIEIRNKLKIKNINDQNAPRQPPHQSPLSFLSFLLSTFEFVSDFDIRISILDDSIRPTSIAALVSVVVFVISAFDI